MYWDDDIDAIIDDFKLWKWILYNLKMINKELNKVNMEIVDYSYAIKVQSKKFKQYTGLEIFLFLKNPHNNLFQIASPIRKIKNELTPTFAFKNCLGSNLYFSEEEWKFNQLNKSFLNIDTLICGKIFRITNNFDQWFSREYNKKNKQSIDDFKKNIFIKDTDKLDIHQIERPFSPLITKSFEIINSMEMSNSDYNKIINNVSQIGYHLMYNNRFKFF